MNLINRRYPWLVVAFFAGTAAPLATQGQSFTPVTDAMLENPPPADWLMWRRTLDGWGYSPLDEIDRGNVANLRMVWSRPMLNDADNQGTPLVHDGVMYMTNPNDLIEALDPRTGDELWAYQRPWPEDLGSYIRFPGRSRNIAIYDDLIINTSGDSYVFALDNVFGKLVWETRVLDYRRNTSQRSSGPIIAGAPQATEHASKSNPVALSSHLQSGSSIIVDLPCHAWIPPFHRSEPHGRRR